MCRSDAVGQESLTFNSIIALCMFHNMLIGVVFAVFYLSTCISHATDDFDVYPTIPRYVSSLDNDNRSWKSLQLFLNSAQLVKTIEIGSKCIGCGALFYLGFGLRRRLYLKRKLDSVGSSDETMHAPNFISVGNGSGGWKSEIDELWTAILNIHNQQQDFNSSIATIKMHLGDYQGASMSQIHALESRIGELSGFVIKMSDFESSLDSLQKSSTQSRDNDRQFIIDEIEFFKDQILNLKNDVKLMIDAEHLKVTSNLKSYLGETNKIIVNLSNKINNLTKEKINSVSNSNSRKSIDHLDKDSVR